MADGKKKELTERQQALLSALAGPAQGDVRKAMEMAGYSRHTSPSEAIRPIADEVADIANVILAMNAPKAALGMVGVVDDPSALGAKNKVAAAKEVLDRAGVVKKDSEVKAPEGAAVFILPPKQPTE
jgi:uncharacterized membrane protein